MTGIVLRLGVLTGRATTFRVGCGLGLRGLTGLATAFRVHFGRGAIFCCREGLGVLTGFGITLRGTLMRFAMIALAVTFLGLRTGVQGTVFGRQGFRNKDPDSNPDFGMQQ
jgi:hypothetical protein